MSIEKEPPSEPDDDYNEIVQLTPGPDDTLVGPVASDPDDDDG